MFCKSGTEKGHEMWVFPVFRALRTYNFDKRNKLDTLRTGAGGNGSVAGVGRLGKFILQSDIFSLHQRSLLQSKTCIKTSNAIISLTEIS